MGDRKRQATVKSEANVAFFQGPNTPLQLHLYYVCFMAIHYPQLFADFYEHFQAQPDATANPAGPISSYFLVTINSSFAWGWFPKFRRSVLRGQEPNQGMFAVLDKEKVAVNKLPDDTVVQEIPGGAEMRALLHEANQAVQTYFGDPDTRAARLSEGREEAARFHSSARAYFHNRHYTDPDYDRNVRRYPEIRFSRLIYENEKERVRKISGGKEGNPEALIQAYRNVNANGEREYDPRIGQPQNSWMNRADHLLNVFEGLLRPVDEMTGNLLYVRFLAHIQGLVTEFRRHDKEMYRAFDFRETTPSAAARQALENIRLYRHIRTLTYAQFRSGQQGTPQESFAEGDPTAELRLRYIYKYVRATGLAQKVKAGEGAAAKLKYNVRGASMAPRPLVPPPGPAPDMGPPSRGRGRGGGRGSRGGRGRGGGGERRGKKRPVEPESDDDDGPEVTFDDEDDQGGGGDDGLGGAPAPEGVMTPEGFDSYLAAMMDDFFDEPEISTPPRSTLASNYVSSSSALASSSSQRRRVYEPTQEMDTGEAGDGYIREEGDEKEFMAFIMIILGWRVRSSFASFVNHDPIHHLKTRFFPSLRQAHRFDKWAENRVICGKKVIDYYYSLQQDSYFTLSPRLDVSTDESKSRYQSLQAAVQRLYGPPSAEQAATWFDEGHRRDPDDMTQTIYTNGDLWSSLTQSLQQGRPFDPIVLRLAENLIYSNVSSYINGLGADVSLFVLHLIRLFGLIDLHKSADATYTRDQIETRFASAGGIGCGRAPLRIEESNTPVLTTFEFMPSAPPPSSVLASSSSSSSSSSSYVPPSSSSSSSSSYYPPLPPVINPFPFTSAFADPGQVDRNRMLAIGSFAPPSSSSSSTMPTPTAAYPSLSNQKAAILPPTQPSSSSSASSFAPPSGPPPESRRTYQGPAPFSSLSSFAAREKDREAPPFFSPGLDPMETQPTKGPHDKSSQTPPEKTPQALEITKPPPVPVAKFDLPSRGATPTDRSSAPSSPRREQVSRSATPDRGYFNDQDILTYLSAKYSKEYEAMQEVALPSAGRPGATDKNFENVLKEFQNVNLK